MNDLIKLAFALALSCIGVIIFVIFTTMHIMSH